MRSYHVTLPALGSVKIDVPASFCKLISDSSANLNTLLLRVENASNKGSVDSDFIELNVGDKPKFAGRVDSFTFTNGDNATRQIVVLIGVGDYDQTVITGSIIVAGGSVNVANLIAGTLVSQDDTVVGSTSSSDVALNANRHEVMIQASPANTGELIIRDTTGTANGGNHLLPGETITLSLSGAVRVRNNTGASQTYSLLSLNS